MNAEDKKEIEELIRKIAREEANIVMTMCNEAMGSCFKFLSHSFHLLAKDYNGH